MLVTVLKKRKQKKPPKMRRNEQNFLKTALLEEVPLHRFDNRDKGPCQGRSRKANRAMSFSFALYADELARLGDKPGLGKYTNNITCLLCIIQALV